MASADHRRNLVRQIVFDGFLKEAGKDHYALVKRGINSLWPTFFGESRSVRVTAIGTRGKIRPADDKYSLGISIFAEADSGVHFKLLFPDDLSAEGFNSATASFLDFLKRYYSSDLDPVTAMQISAVRKVGRTILVTYDPDQRLFAFPDPVPKELDSAK